MTHICNVSVRRLVNWFVSWVSSACDWSARLWSYPMSSRDQVFSCWRNSCCTFQTTIRSKFRSSHQARRHCHYLEYRTFFRLRSNPHSVHSARHCLRRRCTRPPSADTYQPHHWWRMSSIQPTATFRQYAGSTDRHSAMLLAIFIKKQRQVYNTTQLKSIRSILAQQ